MILICPSCHEPFEPSASMIKDAELTEKDDGTTVDEFVCYRCYWEDEMYNTRAWNWR